MQKQLKNGIIFVVFLLLCFLLTFSPLMKDKAVLSPTEAKNAAFDGLIFDDPTAIDSLQVTRRIEKGPRTLYRYDVKFHYQGKDSSVRVLGVPVRNVYLPKGANGSKSKVKLKGEYDKINGAVYDNLQMKKLLNKEKITFQATSEMRIPLSEEVEDYAFTIVTDPATITAYTGKTVADIGVFLTNVKMEKFSDALGIEDKGLRPETSTKTQSGIYTNTLELIDGKAMSHMSTARTIAIVAVVASVVCGLALLLLDKGKLFPVVYVAMVLFAFAVPVARLKVPSNVGIFIGMPILAFVGYLLFKLMSRGRLKLKSVDLRQALGMAIAVFVLATYLFAVPRGLYL
ncbi:hypothetical protein [Aedoeadaptatus urinae]|uniref:hypothetical protein n=1 Tax=Aedoeadaptatus urinae TaxID=1871017 RepID=UPI00097D9B5E|nr:hypothetical protein [Peptoniphilus urinae]